MARSIFKQAYWQILGVIVLILLALLLLWRGSATSNQAMSALVAQVYFDGEYRIGDGPWHEIVQGEHISSTQGDVTLRGNFHILIPDGEYIGLDSGDMPIALYVDHINLTIYEGGNEPYVLDMENPLFGRDLCGVCWSAHTFVSNLDGPVEIVVHNPHRFGNENAIDTTAVEKEVADNMYQRSELDYLIYNDPVAYADLILNGDPETYLKNVTEYNASYES